MKIKTKFLIIMLSNNYVYIFSSLLIASSVAFYFISFRSYKSEANNKILLKNLLEGLDMDLPDELKSLENRSRNS